MKRLLVSLATLVLSAWYWIVRRVFGQRRKIVCLSRQSDSVPVDFALIKACVEEHYPDFEVVVLARTISNPFAYAVHMFRQVFEIATSSAVILDSYCIAVSLLNMTIEAPVVQMWHAMGNMKRFGYAALDEPEGRSSDVARLMHMHEGYDSVVISSMDFIDDYVAGFNVSPDIVFECPLPKTDLLLDQSVRKKRRERILGCLPQLRDKVNIVYCPTFRKPPTEADALALRRLSDSVDFEKYNLIYKAHPVSTLRFKDPRVIQDYDSSFDMLYVADFVISDYSTVIYEAGLLDLPVLLYTYDWDQYKKRRGLNIDFVRDIPAPSSADPRELMSLIEGGKTNREAFRSFVDRYVRVPEHGSCTQRLVEHVMSLISDRVR